MNSIVPLPPVMLRPATPSDIERRTERAIEAVEDGNENALLAFAEHLAEEGELGNVADLGLDMTVRQLVERQITTRDGRAALKAWARGLAEEQIELADGYVAA